MKEIASALMSLLISVFCFFVRPTITFDASDLTGDVMGGASGYLYGIAEEGVPTKDMTDSLDITSVSAKTAGGLQHPIGDVEHIAPQIVGEAATDYIVVYLQDMYATWYYDETDINERKSKGEYDFQQYIAETYFPMIDETVARMREADYAGKLVYCLYNECDNGVWFGEWVENGDGGGRNDFNDTGKQRFYEAWRLTYDYVKALDGQALIGGPGYFEYHSEKLEGFLQFASENGCVPDVLIYHELQDRSVYDWQAHVKDLHSLEEKYGIDTATPVIVTEYGRMRDNGDPCAMAKYIVQIETAKIYGQQAYWLLANNLSSTCAGANTPNSAWWVYRWYANMSGQTMDYKISDLTHADVGKALREKRELRYEQLLALGSLSDDKDRIDILSSGVDYDHRIKIRAMDTTALYGKTVRVTVERVAYQGLSGEVFAPETVKSFTQRCGRSISVDMKKTDSSSAYHIVIEAAEDTSRFVNDNLYLRFEFEDGDLIGNAYIYESAYAATGVNNGMVGGIEKDGDGVDLGFRVPDDGDYEIVFIYGKSADGLSAEYRRSAAARMTLNGEEAVLTLPNTVRSEYTGSFSMVKSLRAGTNHVIFMHRDGSFVLDSLLVRKVADSGSIYVEKDFDYADRYLAVAPYNGIFSVDGENTFLKRGVNFIDSGSFPLIAKTASAGPIFSAVAADFVLADGAEFHDGYIDGVSSEGGSAEITVNAPKRGMYHLVVTYASGRENGAHAYNIDLVEDYITLSVNGEKQKNFYTRNTCSFENYAAAVTDIDLAEGENRIRISNDGENIFNGNPACAPRIAEISIYE